MDRVDEAIKAARSANGGECGDCEGAVMELMKLLPDGHRGHGPGVHDWYAYEGEVLDPTAAQFTDLCTGRTHHTRRIGEAELRRAGLDKAVVTGRFTREQHERFRGMIPRG